MSQTAVTVYIDNNKIIIQEFNWLYKSFLYSRLNNVDIVAFYNPSIQMDKLPKDNSIKYIPLLPLSELKEEWKDYKFINSIYYLTTQEASILTNYEYVLRTDCDCFLTPNFANLRPRLATFGMGLYALEPSVSVRLAQIAEKWNIQTMANNIGSTVMAYSNRVLQFSQLHMEYCRKLKAEEFPDGYGEWPKWYFGVLTMYAGQLAANSYFGTGMVLGGLDIHCTAHEPMCATDYHIHAWHTHGDFSKFKWRQGGYKHTDMSKLRHNYIDEYCLWIAGSEPCV